MKTKLNQRKEKLDEQQKKSARMKQKNGKKAQVFLYQYVYKLTIWNVLDVLAQSPISRSHCGRLSPSCNYVNHSSNLLSFIFILLFSHAVIVFSTWVAVLFFASLCHF